MQEQCFCRYLPEDGSTAERMCSPTDRGKRHDRIEFWSYSLGMCPMVFNCRVLAKRYRCCNGRRFFEKLYSRSSPDVGHAAMYCWCWKLNPPSGEYGLCSPPSTVLKIDEVRILDYLWNCWCTSLLFKKHYTFWAVPGQPQTQAIRGWPGLPH